MSEGSRERRSLTSSVAAVLAAALAGAVVLMAPSEHSAAQQRGPLVIGGTRSNFGVIDLRGGFMPDPRMHDVVSGGTIDASTLSLAPGCRGFVTAQPDVIVRYSSPASWVRFFVRAQGDTTLVINDANGRWYCDDDTGGSLNPMVDIRAPGAGQFDVWIGSYRSGENIRGQLGITELTGVRP